jgi:hypothetical protein
MEIHLVSSLTSDDESRLAPEMLVAIGRVLEKFPVSYSLRIETEVGSAIQRHHTARQVEAPDAIAEEPGVEVVTIDPKTSA